MHYAPGRHTSAKRRWHQRDDNRSGGVRQSATFAVVNIEDDPSVSLPTPVVQSIPPTDAVAAQRTDRGPEEGTAQQSTSAGTELRGSKAFAKWRCRVPLRWA
jgi:hypothetical protein